MAENNLLMTIVLVVAATLLFSGGLTGNATGYQERFGFTTANPSVNLGGEVTCSPVKEGRTLSNGKPAVVQVNKDCSETVTDLCVDISKPWITVSAGYGLAEVQCRRGSITSGTDIFPGVY